MALNSGGIAQQYSTKFSQLAVKKHLGDYQERSLELLIKEAINHFRIIKSESFEDNLANFKAQVKAYGAQKDAAYDSRVELYEEALPLIEKYQ